MHLHYAYSFTLICSTNAVTANKTSTTELNTINYQIVNEKIQEKRRESLDYLCEIVGSDK